MNFKDWFVKEVENLKEVGTSTGDVANFSLPLFSGMAARTWPPLLTFNGETHKKKKKKKKKE